VLGGVDEVFAVLRAPAVVPELVAPARREEDAGRDQEPAVDPAQRPMKRSREDERGDVRGEDGDVDRCSLEPHQGAGCRQSDSASAMTDSRAPPVALLRLIHTSVRYRTTA
jgi:hypothetical protein